MEILEGLDKLGLDGRNIGFVEGTYFEANRFIGCVGRSEALYGIYVSSVEEDTLIKRVEGPITSVDARVGALSIFYGPGKVRGNNFDYRNMDLVEFLEESELSERRELRELIDQIRDSFKAKFSQE